MACEVAAPEELATRECAWEGCDVSLCGLCCGKYYTKGEIEKLKLKTPFSPYSCPQIEELEQQALAAMKAHRGALPAGKPEWLQDREDEEMVGKISKGAMGIQGDKFFVPKEYALPLLHGLPEERLPVVLPGARRQARANVCPRKGIGPLTHKQTALPQIFTPVGTCAAAPSWRWTC